jgi:hypothetical protein
MEEATFFCSEHAFQVRHFDNDDFAAVLLVNDTEVVDATPDKTPVVGDVPPDDQALYDEWYEALSGLADDAPADDVQGCTFTVQDPDYEKLRPLFGWMNAKTVKKTFENTTQHARMPHATILKKHYKSPYPALNVRRRDEPVATDTVFSDTPAIDGGETCAQIFVGTDALVTDVCGMKSKKQFVNTLEDNICERGAMN